MERFPTPNPAWRIRASVAGLLLCLLPVMLAGCSRTPPEQALREQVAALQAAIEEKRSDALSEILADDFVGEGGLDRAGARRLAMLHFMRNAEVGLQVGPLDVAISDDHATVRCTVLLTGGTGRLLPQSGRLYEVETGWRRAGDDWRMTSANWEPQL